MIPSRELKGFKKGDRVLYCGSWGAGPARPGWIIGQGEESGALVYDVLLEGGDTRWGYEDQFSPDEDAQRASPAPSALALATPPRSED